MIDFRFDPEARSLALDTKAGGMGPLTGAGRPVSRPRCLPRLAFGPYGQQENSARDDCIALSRHSGILSVGGHYIRKRRRYYHRALRFLPIPGGAEEIQNPKAVEALRGWPRSREIHTLEVLQASQGLAKGCAQ